MEPRKQKTIFILYLFAAALAFTAAAIDWIPDGKGSFTPIAAGLAMLALGFATRSRLQKS